MRERGWGSKLADSAIIPGTRIYCGCSSFETSTVATTFPTEPGRQGENSCFKIVQEVLKVELLYIFKGSKQINLIVPLLTGCKLPTVHLYYTTRQQVIASPCRTHLPLVHYYTPYIIYVLPVLKISAQNFACTSIILIVCRRYIFRPRLTQACTGNNKEDWRTRCKSQYVLLLLSSNPLQTPYFAMQIFPTCSFYKLCRAKQCWQSYLYIHGVYIVL